jgi:RNA polymerase sigma-70 factor (ECF subfamily)
MGLAGTATLHSMEEEKPGSASPTPSDPTTCLLRFAAGDREARDKLFEVVYAQLSEKASACLRSEPAGLSLQTVDLVHETWLRLFDQDRTTIKNRGHFLALAAKAMRRILVDHARTRTRSKRDARRKVSLDEAAGVADDQGCENLLAVDQALEKLRGRSERMAQVVELQFFGGLSREEIAEALGTSASTVDREWRTARAMMSVLLED